MFKKVVFILLLTASSTFSVGVYLEEGASTGLYYDNTTHQYMLRPVCDIEFALRFDNSDGVLEKGIINGFRIYIDNDHNGIPDEGVTFTPVSTSGTPDNPWLNCDGFFYFTGMNALTANGTGADTVGVFGLYGPEEYGYPAGYNEIVLKITTGGVEPGNTLCLDSSFYGKAGVWKWDSGVVPEWGGPYCYQAADVPAEIPVVNNLPPDTLVYNYCGIASYDFDTENGIGNYLSNNSLGTLDENTGYWSMPINQSMDGQTFDIDFTVYQSFVCIGQSYNVPVKIDLIASHAPFDLNQDCQSDVSDVVSFIDFMFNNGDMCEIRELYDCNGSGGIDITDLVYLIDYFFNSGPAPVSPWD